MRHQERNVSEFDEIITYPPSAAPSGEKQVMSCVQAFTAALGFAMSAGWDWLPSMHTLWLRDYIEAVSMPTPFGFFGTLSGSIFFKMIMLLALCPVMERLFHAFPLDRVAFRRKPFPNADYALLPPALRERIYLSTPLILAQLCAILLLLVLTFSLPPCLDGLMPWLLGTVSALFGLIWFVLVTLLPGVWSGISYGLAITFSILISLLLDTAPAESLARFRMLFPILAIPLIFFAMPPSDDIRRRIRRHHRQCLFSTRVKGVLLRGLLLRRLSYLDILSKQGSVYLVLCVFPIMYGVQILLDFCEQSRKLRISVTRFENGPDHFFKYGMVFALRILTEKTSQRGRGAVRVKTDTNRASFLCLFLRRKHRCQPIVADVVILPRQFHSHIAAACPDARFAHAAASHERVKYAGLRSCYGQQVLNQRHGLAGQVNLLRGNYRVGVYARQAGPRMRDETSLGGEQHVLALLAELTDLRAGAPLVPGYDAAPCPARRLHGVAQGRKLPPVREHHKRRALAGDAPALAKP